MAKYLLQVLLLTGLYFVFGQASFSLSVSHGIVTLVVFAAEGFALAAVILFGTRLWLGVFLGQLALALANGLAWHIALGISVINSLEAVIGAKLFQRLALQSSLAKIRDVSGLLLLIFFVLQPFSATLGNLLLWLGHVVPASQLKVSWFSWWFGNALGQVLITPLLLTIFSCKDNLMQDFHCVRKPLVLFISTAAIVFSTSLFSSVTIAFAITVPLLILITATGGMAMVNLATVIVASAALFLTQQMRGVFVHDGTILLLDLNGYLLSMALTGQFMAVLFGEYKQAQVEQQATLERLQKIAGRLPGMIFQFRLNPDGSSCFPYSSLAVQDIFHLTPDQVQKDSSKILATLHPDDIEQFMSAMNHSAQNLTPWLHEYRIRFDDDCEHWLLSNALPEQEADGSTLWHGFVTDITEQKKVQKILQNKERMLSDAQQIAHIGSWSLNVATGQIIWSDEMYKIYGVTSETFDHSVEAFVNLIHPDDRTKMQRWITDCLAEENPPELDFCIELPDSTLRFIRGSGGLQYDEMQRLLGAVGTARDITEQRQREEALHQAKQAAEKANLAKSEFLSSMSHELRTPMNAVLGFAQLLESEGLTEDQRESVQYILTAGHHLMDLINEVLDLSQIEADKMELNLEMFDVETLVQNCLNLVQPLTVENKIIIFDNTCSDCHGSVKADKIRFKQVLLNLISNAIKYNRIGGSVTISCTVMNPQRLRINVADTGKGLSEPQLAKLFQPFERLGAKNSSIEGTGIGLVISKKLIEAMNGRIGVESTVGEGSCFWVEVPLA